MPPDLSYEDYNAWAMDLRVKYGIRWPHQYDNPDSDEPDTDDEQETVE